MPDHVKAPGLPRWFECTAATVATLLLSPLMLVLALLIRITSPGPAFFRQQRVGQGGRPFELLKFRTMLERGPVNQRSESSQPPPESHVTATGDQRVTAVGRFLRATKLDELPELINVVRGDMSVVGPRPEVPRYVDLDDPRWVQVLSVRPGLTDVVTLEMRNEEGLLAAGAVRLRTSAEDFYRESVLPYKLERTLATLPKRSAWGDVSIALRTAFAILRRSSSSDRELLQRIIERSDVHQDSVEGQEN